MKVQIEIDNQVVVAEGQNIRGEIWLHYQGRTFIYQPESQKKRNRKLGAAGTGSILAPMPGKVTRILKAKMDNVNHGDALLVMEAMKMEYTLKADVAGVVDSISCQVGEQVSLGQKLVHVKATATPGEG